MAGLVAKARTIASCIFICTTGASLAAATSSLTWSSAAKADWQSIMVIAADNTSKRLLNLFLDILLTSNQTDCSVSIKRLYIFSTIKVK